MISNIFGVIELTANSVLLFMLTPDTLYCCCKRPKHFEPHDLDSGYIYQTGMEIDRLQSTLLEEEGIINE